MFGVGCGMGRLFIQIQCVFYSKETKKPTFCGSTQNDGEPPAPRGPPRAHHVLFRPVLRQPSFPPASCAAGHTYFHLDRVLPPLSKWRGSTKSAGPQRRFPRHVVNKNSHIHRVSSRGWAPTVLGPSPAFKMWGGLWQWQQASERASERRRRRPRERRRRLLIYPRVFSPDTGLVARYLHNSRRKLRSFVVFCRSRGSLSRGLPPHHRVHRTCRKQLPGGC